VNGSLAERRSDSQLPTYYFGGLRFNPLTVAQTVDLLRARPADAPFSAFVTPNVEHCYFVRRDREHAACVSTCLVSTNDSRVLRRIGLLAGIDLEFAPGAYVVADLFQSVIGPDDIISVIGSSESIVERLKSRFGLKTVHHHIPPMGFINDLAAVEAAVDFVVAHPARFVFVAMGPPQSEKFCHRIGLRGTATGIGLCIGSSLSVLVGDTSAAPDVLENAGLVWLYRLLREPGRLWRRYLVRDMIGLWHLAIDVVRRRLGIKTRPYA